MKSTVADTKLDTFEQEILAILSVGCQDVDTNNLVDEIIATRKTVDSYDGHCTWLREPCMQKDCAVCKSFSQGVDRNFRKSLQYDVEAIKLDIAESGKLSKDHLHTLWVLAGSIMMPLLSGMMQFHTQVTRIGGQHVAQASWGMTEEGQSIMWYAGVLPIHAHALMQARLALESGDTSVLATYRIHRLIIEEICDEIMAALAVLSETKSDPFREWIYVMIDLRSRILIL